MKPRRTSPQKFFECLLDLRNALDFDLSKTPMDFRPRPNWLATSPGLSVHLFYFCIRGVIHAEATGRSHTLRTGEGIWINAGSRFLLESPDVRHTLVSRFRLSLRTPGREPMILGHPAIVAPDVHSHWLELVKHESCLPGDTPSRALRCALAGLIAGAFLDQPNKAIDPGARKLSKAQIRQLTTWLQDLPPHTRPTSTDLAKQLKLSRDYLNRLFRATFGFSTEHWLIQHRIRNAAQRLVESPLSVSEVADEAGYRSLYFFSRQFRSIMRCSPTEWRQRHHH